MGKYVEGNLIAGEQVVYQTRIHPIVFLAPGAFIILGILVGVFAIPSAGLAVLGLAC
jgi:hypothetical protein